MTAAAREPSLAAAVRDRTLLPHRTSPRIPPASRCIARTPAVDPNDFDAPLDTQQLLQRHARTLVAEATAILTADPRQRLAGMITLPDAVDAQAVRAMIAGISGHAPKPGLFVGLVPRALVEPWLATRAADYPWREQGWSPQNVLPICVSTREGLKFGFFAVGPGSGPER